MSAPTTTTTPAQPTTTTVVEQTTTTTSSPPNTTCNGNPSTDWSCCNYNEPCAEGGGDCDHDSDCIGALKCGNNNCQADFSGPGSNWSPAADCCYGNLSILLNYKMIILCKLKFIHNIN